MTDWKRFGKELKKALTEDYSIKTTNLEESAVAPLNQEFPLVKTMENMKKWFNMIENVFSSFEVLTGHMLKQLNEDDFDTNINAIQQRIITVKNWENNLKNAVPMDLTPKNVITSIKFYCSSIDGYVNSANVNVFQIIETGHWIDADGKKFKNLYVGLIELAKMFYNRCITLNQEQHKPLVRKTKDVMGNQLHSLASSTDTSLTDSTMYKWLTQEQFNLSMKPEDLKIEET